MRQSRNVIEGPTAPQTMLQHRSIKPFIFFIALGELVTLTCFFIAGNVDLIVLDEGFFYDGVLRTLAGQMPMIDFLSYDPYQYFSCAAVMKLIGTSILDLRLSLYLFLGLGVGTGAWLIFNAINSLPLALVTVLALCLCIPWPIRTFVFVSPILVIAAGYIWLKGSALKDWFIFGCVVGLTACFGRNLGLYAFVSANILFGIGHAIKAHKLSLRGYFAFLAGVSLGYLPMISLAVLTPGFLKANLEWLNLLSYSKNLNLTLPYPWIFTNGSPSVVGVTFTLLPLLFLGSIAAIFLKRHTQSKSYYLLCAATPVAIVFFHHTTTRADIPHLGDVLSASIILSIAFAASFRMKTISVTFAAITTFLFCASMVNVNPTLIAYFGNPEKWLRIQFSGKEIYVPQGTAAYIEYFRSVHRQVIKEDPFVILPVSSVHYQAVGQLSPIFDGFSLFARPESYQMRMIDELQSKQIKWIFFLQLAVDSSDPIVFAKQSPLVHKFINENFEVVNDLSNFGYVVLRRKIQ